MKKIVIFFYLFIFPVSLMAGEIFTHKDKDGTIIICTADSQSKINRINKRIEIVLVEPNK